MECPFGFPVSACLEKCRFTRRTVSICLETSLQKVRDSLSQHPWKTRNRPSTDAIFYGEIKKWITVELSLKNSHISWWEWDLRRQSCFQTSRETVQVSIKPSSMNHSNFIIQKFIHAHRVSIINIRLRNYGLSLFDLPKMCILSK